MTIEIVVIFEYEITTTITFDGHIKNAFSPCVKFLDAHVSAFLFELIQKSVLSTVSPTVSKQLAIHLAQAHASCVCVERSRATVGRYLIAYH